VSKSVMRGPVYFLLLTTCLWAQTGTEEVAIREAQSLRASSLDGRLPNISLKFLLEYEARGAPVKWEVRDCGELAAKSTTESGDASTCIEASFDPDDRTSVALIISIPDSGNGSHAAPATLLRATISDMGAPVRTTRRLGDLPMELHRPKPRLPQEPALPVRGV